MSELEEVPYAPIELRYRPLLELGRGGTARVFLAETLATGLKKLVVLKTLEPELSMEVEMRSLFRREAEVCARLNHPNIVQVNEVVEQVTGPVIVMEYLEGIALSEVIAESKASPKRLYLHAITQLLAGLHYFHELKDYDRTTALKPVHRDVSPQNVVILYEGAVKVLDFGIAKLTTAESATRTGIIKGKLHYMPAEQLLGDAALDRRADIFSAGVMLWEALAGQRMWHHQSDNAVVKALINGALPSLREVEPNLSEHCYAVVEKSLAHNPSDRYATALEMQIDVERILAEMGGPVHPREISAYMQEEFGARRREREAAIEQAARSPGNISLTSGQHVALNERQDTRSRSASYSRTATQTTQTKRSGRGVAAALATICIAGIGVYWVGLRNPVTSPAPATAQTIQQQGELVSLSVVSDPVGARVSLDGSPLGVTPWVGRLPVKTQTATLEVRADGYESFTQTVTLSQDSSIEVHLQPHTPPIAASGAASGVPSGDEVTKSKLPGKFTGGRVRHQNAPPSTKNPTKPNCNPPYTLSPDGIRTYKAECF